MKHSQRGSTVVGIIIGIVLGLAAALAVAVYVTKVPIPFLNRGQNRSAEQDAAEIRRNRDWDPNAPLYGKNPAKALPPAPGVAAPAPPVAIAPAPNASAPAAKGKAVDPLGQLAMSRAATAQAADPFFYFVQAGAFRSPDDAEAQRAKLSLMGIDAKVTEREQSGRQVFRVRIGPFDKKEEADRQKERLDSGGVETALVRVQR